MKQFLISILAATLFFLITTFAVSQNAVFSPAKQEWEYRLKNTEEWKKGLPDTTKELRRLLENSGWETRTKFFLKNSTDKLQYQLIAEGLSPYSKLYVNDIFCDEIKNSLHSKTIEITEQLKIGDINEIKIYFPSPLLCAGQEYKNDSTNYPSDNEETEKKVSQFLRMPPVSFGWDIAERDLPRRMGKGIRIASLPLTTIQNVYIRTEYIKNDTAFCKATIHSKSVQSPTATLQLTIESEGKSIFHKTYSPSLSGNLDSVTFSFELIHPKLWWPNGLYQQFGSKQPHLYTVKIFLVDSVGIKLAERKQQFGVRTIQLKQEKDVFGKSFQFDVNGAPVFMKGGNYIAPVHSDDNSNWKNLLSKISEAGFNMIRVWGGGNYLSEEQMRDCDSLGILVWQDFIFSGTMYPGDTHFLSAVEEEVIFQVREKRTHASMALWCGNNEIEVAWKNWGWQTKYNLHGKDGVYLADSYNKIFRQLIPKIILSEDGITNYIPTSPLSNWGTEEDFLEGDNHYWGVWHGEYPLSTYQKFIPRFMSEFGLPSFPSIQSMRKEFLSDSFLETDSKIKSRLRSYKGLSLLKKYVSEEIGEPKDLFSFALLSQIMQANALREAIEAQRRSKPFCMGTLFWQLNDIWPGITWSAIENNGTPKPALQSITDAFQPILLSGTTERNRIQVFAVSDLLKDTSLNIKILVVNKNGETTSDTSFSCKIPALSSRCIFEKPKVDSSKENPWLMLMEYELNNDTITNAYFFEKKNNLNGNKTLKKKYKNGALEITASKPGEDVVIFDTKSERIVSHYRFIIPGKTIRFPTTEQNAKSIKIFLARDLVKTK